MSSSEGIRTYITNLFPTSAFSAGESYLKYLPYIIILFGVGVGIYYLFFHKRFTTPDHSVGSNVAKAEFFTDNPTDISRLSERNIIPFSLSQNLTMTALIQVSTSRLPNIRTSRFNLIHLGNVNITETLANVITDQTHLELNQLIGVYIDKERNNLIFYITPESSNSSSAPMIYTVENYPVRKPFHLAVVLNNRTLEIYIDAKLVATHVLPSMPIRINSGSATPPIIRTGFNNLSSNARGHIMFLRVYSNSLDASQILQEFNSFGNIAALLPEPEAIIMPTEATCPAPTDGSSAGGN